MNNAIFREHIVKKFIELCEEIPFREIKISDITNRCGISRQTFYHHFKDKYDLIETIYKKTITEFSIPQFMNESGLHEGLHRSFAHCLEEQKYYMSVISYDGQNSFENYFLKDTREYFRSIIIQRHGQEALTPSIEFSIEYACHGSCFMFINWIRNGMKESPEFMADELYKCLPDDLKQLLP